MAPGGEALAVRLPMGGRSVLGTAWPKYRPDRHRRNLPQGP